MFTRELLLSLFLFQYPFLWKCWNISSRNEYKKPQGFTGTDRNSPYVLKCYLILKTQNCPTVCFHLKETLIFLQYGMLLFCSITKISILQMVAISLPSSTSQCTPFFTLSSLLLLSPILPFSIPFLSVFFYVKCWKRVRQSWHNSNPK